MTGFLVILIIGFLIFGLVLLFTEEETRLWGVVLLMASGFGMYACATNPSLVEQRRIEAEIEAANNKKCQIPYLVSEVKDIELWAYRPDCNARQNDIVYFSKSGTQYTECHTEGKHQVCNAKRVTNNRAKE